MESGKVNSKNSGTQALAVMLVAFLIGAGSIAMAPAVLASPGNGNETLVDTDFIGPFQVDVAQSTPSTCYPGSHIPVLQITFTNIGGPIDMFQQLIVLYTGTNPADVQSGLIYFDVDGNGVLNYAIDIPIAGTPNIGGVFNLNPGWLLNAPPFVPMNFWVTMQTDNLATIGNIVDAMIPPGGILLQNFGQNTILLNPTDFPNFCTFVSNIFPPQPIYGYVMDSDLVTPIVGVSVTVTEGATGEFISDITDASGRYDVDLNDLLFGYTDGDTITAETPVPTQAYGFTVLDLGDPLTWQINLIVDTTPPITALSIVPDYDNTGGWNVDFTQNDPLVNGYASGVRQVDIYVDTPLSAGFVYWGSQTPPFTGTLPYVPIDGEGLYSFYSIGIDYAGNVEVKGIADDSIIYDTTNPTSVVTGPAYSGNWNFDLNYTTNDPEGNPPEPASGVAGVSLYVTTDGGSTWTPLGDDTPADGVIPLAVGADGTYGWYTAAFDNAGNSEFEPPFDASFIEYSTIVDTVAPTINATTATLYAFNNQGTFGGTPPPTTITASVWDPNLAVAAVGIRNFNQLGNSTIYFACNFTADPTSFDWYGTWYFIETILVTAAIVPEMTTVDIFVFGELNGVNGSGAVIGKVVPSHYADFDISTGALQAIYDTMGTLEYGDDVAVATGPADNFRPYIYNEGPGYIATSLLRAWPEEPGNEMALETRPIVDGWYAICTTVLDKAGNSAWTNETTVNQIMVDNYAPYANATGPATSTVQAFDVTYTWYDAPWNGASTSGFPFVRLYYQRNAGGWNLYGDDNGLDGSFPVDVSTIGGDGTYDWFMVAYDTAGNHEDDSIMTAEATTIVDSTNPFALITTPLNGAINVPLAVGTYVIEFSEPMNTLAGVVTTDLPGALQSWFDADTLYIDYTLLTESTTYNVDLSLGGFQDLYGNPLIAGAYGWTFAFTTIGISPEVVTTTPLNGAINVPLAVGTYVIEFSEPMNTLAGVVTTDLPGALQSWFDADTLYIDYTLLTESTTYNVDLSLGGFQDLYGNPLIAGAYGWTFTFTTIGINPEVVTTVPLNGAINVPVTAGTYVIEFSEPMNTLVGVVTTDLPGATPSWFDADTLNLAYTLLTVSTTYNIDLSTGGFEDLYGNPLNAGAYGWTFTFTTIGILPIIINTVPFDGETGVAINLNIVITFSKEMNPATFTYTCNPDPTGWTVIWNAPFNDIVTLSHTDFTEFTLYTFTVVTAEDTFGNTLVAGAVPNPWSFETFGYFTLNLVNGWNLIAISVLNPVSGPTSLNFASDFAQMTPAPFMISRWDQGGQRYVNFIFGFHLPGDPQDFPITPDEAYWLWMPTPCVYLINGELPHQRNVALVPGWNMVGYMHPTAIGDVETDWAWQVTCGAYDDIAYYNGGFIHYIFMGTVMPLNPGRGYFVWSDAPVTLTYSS